MTGDAALAARAKMSQSPAKSVPTALPTTAGSSATSSDAECCAGQQEAELSQGGVASASHAGGGGSVEDKLANFFADISKMEEEDSPASAEDTTVNAVTAGTSGGSPPPSVAAAVTAVGVDDDAAEVDGEQNGSTNLASNLEATSVPDVVGAGAGSVRDVAPDVTAAAPSISSLQDQPTDFAVGPYLRDVSNCCLYDFFVRARVYAWWCVCASIFVGVCECECAYVMLTWSAVRMVLMDVWRMCLYAGRGLLLGLG